MSTIKIGDIAMIPWQETSHGVGKKKILFQGLPVTQIAISEIQSGEVIEHHVHHDMDEFFLVTEGQLQYEINHTDKGVLTQDTFIYVAKGNVHSFKNLGEVCVKMITFAVINNV